MEILLKIAVICSGVAVAGIHLMGSLLKVNIFLV